MANQNDRKEKYTILDPSELYHGKSYSDWTADWFNWFLSANADKRNSGPVVFLRSHGLPNRNSGAYISDVPSRSTLTDTSPSGSSIDSDYPAIYVNDPNFRIGNEGLQIFDDQAVFVPIIVAYQLGGSVAPYRDWGYLQEYVGSLIDNGDNPPDPIQLTIDTEPINLTINGEEHGKENETKLVMKDFRITTPIFMAVVPEAPYGTSIKDFLEEGSIPAGTYPASVDGYFVMLKFKNPGRYLVHSWASAGREAKGPYFSELLYEIQVVKRPKPHGMITSMIPMRNEGLFNRTLQKKRELGEITGEQYKAFESFKLYRQRLTEKLSRVHEAISEEGGHDNG